MSNLKLKDIKIGVNGEKPETLGILSRNKNVEYFQGEAKKQEVEARVKPGELISRLEHPEDIYYDGDIIRLSPRSRLPIANMDKVGIDSKNKLHKLPSRVILIPKK